jgi:subtilase family serine protease
VIKDADDAAVAAGLTVVVSSGDSGPTNTIGSPATDPNVIDVGAMTTFRTYAQTDSGGFYNPVVGNGRCVDNNISALSSGGFDQTGSTVDLVAPGDVNWALCSSNSAMFSDCTAFVGGTENGMQAGGTSESAPLTSAAAADVIQAYAKTHGGSDPSPALVKQILMSSATDIDAPATEQGAGLLNVLAAVRLADRSPALARSITLALPYRAPSVVASSSGPTR